MLHLMHRSDMDKITKFNQVVEFAKNVLSGATPLSNEVRSRLAQLFEEYLELCPPEELDHTIVAFKLDDNGSPKIIAVKKRDIPKAIKEDDDFFQSYLKVLAS